MDTLSGGAALIAAGTMNRAEGTRRFRVPISKRMGSRDIAQTISAYSKGVATARRNPQAEEVLYVVAGKGLCYIDGFPYQLSPGVCALIMPGVVYQIENSDEQTDLEIVSVCCPEDELVETVETVPRRDPKDTKPARTLNEQSQKAIPTGDRTFKLLAGQQLGAKRVTQFVGRIPPGRAPMHHHTYEEAIYIIEGNGRLWAQDGAAEFEAGASIYLPRGVTHSLENIGSTDIRLLGVFHPSGSPAVRYDD